MATNAPKSSNSTRADTGHRHTTAEQPENVIVMAAAVTLGKGARRTTAQQLGAGPWSACSAGRTAWRAPDHRPFMGLPRRRREPPPCTRHHLAGRRMLDAGGRFSRTIIQCCTESRSHRRMSDACNWTFGLTSKRTSEVNPARTGTRTVCAERPLPSQTEQPPRQFRNNGRLDPFSQIYTG